jgi:hypothetical protein
MRRRTRRLPTPATTPTSSSAEAWLATARPAGKAEHTRGSSCRIGRSSSSLRGAWSRPVCFRIRRGRSSSRERMRPSSPPPGPARSRFARARVASLLGTQTPTPTQRGSAAARTRSSAAVQRPSAPASADARLAPPRSATSGQATVGSRASLRTRLGPATVRTCTRGAMRASNPFWRRRAPRSRRGRSNARSARRIRKLPESSGRTKARRKPRRARSSGTPQRECQHAEGRDATRLPESCSNWTEEPLIVTSE